MLNVPDRISMDELSNLWIYKALKQLEADRNQESQPENEDCSEL
jgi:hypothetical protein